VAGICLQTWPMLVIGALIFVAQERSWRPPGPCGPAVKNSSRRSSRGQRLQGNLVAQALEASNKLPLDTHAVAFIEICRAEVHEVHSAFEDVVGDDEQAMGESNDGFLGTSPSSQAPKLGRDRRSSPQFMRRIDCS